MWQVYDADSGLATGDVPCHGGPGGSYRALCAQNNIITGTCQWYGTPAACTGSCPRGWIQVSANSNPKAFGSIQCPAGRYSVFCCDTVDYSADPLACEMSGLNYILGGGLAPRLENNQNLQFKPVEDANYNAGCTGLSSGDPFGEACASSTPAPSSTSTSCDGCYVLTQFPSAATPTDTFISTSATLAPRGVPRGLVPFRCDTNQLFGTVGVDLYGAFDGTAFVQSSLDINPSTITTTSTTTTSISYTTTSRTCDGVCTRQRAALCSEVRADDRLGCLS